ncbi:hypothetical protein ACFOZ0_27590 [Streptomyces yaanensis]|uniref:Bacterial Ig domain-containing protein n=1 Tax=Streptomyces yaanensis TaxID=1142239 RepID=A0ABV7SJ00_9ACTN|nr:hypothetical protein [Streptomyces sp. CGMCC 4.7035]WNB97015.1 hypothetical protein Q2K21_02425 [Streptomyces sp. CGMCC 4.7035]
MKSSLRTRSTRALTAGALSVALLTGGTAAAFAAASPSPSPKMSRGSMTRPEAPKQQAAPPKRTTTSIMVKVDKPSVKPGQSVVFTEHTKGLAVGSTLRLQRLNGTKWVTVKTTTVKKGGVYTFNVKLTNKGTQKFRVSRGTTVSPNVTVTVK